MPRTPVWKTIFETLQAEIVNGSVAAGDRLPTEKEFSERFSVNRHTVRRALAELSQAGIITVRRGSGAYVAEGVLDYKIDARTRFSQNISDLGRAPSLKILDSAKIACDERVAEHLRLRPGKPVLRLVSVGEADATPICMSEQYFPFERFPGLVEKFESTRSITAALREYGVIDYTRAWTRISAVAPRRLIAKTLRQPESTPVLRAEALNLNMAGEPIELGVTHFAGQRAALMVDTTS